MKDKFISIRVDTDDKEFVKVHAKKNCRSIIDTYRLVLKEWIRKEKKKALKLNKNLS
jgi:hypothetical protein